MLMLETDYKQSPAFGIVVLLLKVTLSCSTGEHYPNSLTNSMFKLSKRSLNNLQGVKPPLVAVVHRAIQLTSVDFVVIEGVRTLKRQQELVNQGASQTLNSKHITGDAVDLAAWLGTIRWELPLYFKIADAVKQAAIEQGVPIRWGGAWTIRDIRGWSGSMEADHQEYVAARRAMGESLLLMVLILN